MKESALKTKSVISVRGARTHNLKNIDVDIPRHQLVVITGLSGSGKSSLAFDTLYAEGQRRYVESLSSYARQFLQMMDKPDVDLIEGLAPAIAIEQKSTNHNPRSTVGTVTEVHDFLRLLFARVGTPYCPEHHLPLTSQTISQMVDAILVLPDESKIMLLSPVVKHRKGEFLELFADMQSRGYIRFQVDGQIYDAQDVPKLDSQVHHDIAVVVDRLRVRPEMRQRLAESLEQAVQLSDGKALVVELDTGEEHLFSARFACPVCDYALAELEPRLFSFNSPSGACPECDGLGVAEHFSTELIVAFPSLSLASGAILGWDKRNALYFSLLDALAKHYRFDINTPYEDLPERIQNILMFGSGDENIVFSYPTGGRSSVLVEKAHPFEGVVNNFKRRFHESTSDVVKSELGKYMLMQPCESCSGSRLRKEARNVYIGEGSQLRNLPMVNTMTLKEAQRYFSELKLQGAKAAIAEKILAEVSARLGFLNNVGLDYLSLLRCADTLSGGESQRIRLASQIGSGLTGVMYVLDEPSIGLHQRDNDRLIETLRQLKDLGNSVLVVEHDEDAIRAADHVIDMGPGAGVQGGKIVAQGSPQDIENTPDSLTGQYLKGVQSIKVPKVRMPWRVLPDKGASELTTDAIKHGQCVEIKGASGNNLKHVGVAFPVGLMTCVTGVSGSGKSTLVNNTLYAGAAQQLNRAKKEIAPHESITGLNYLDKVISVDQAPIGRTPRSNPATYTGLFTPIRELFAQVPAARERGYGAGRFSFNVKGGRCEACQGDGVLQVEMHFLPNVYVPCEVCHGRRYNRETLEIFYKHKNIAEVLDMTVEEACEFFSAVPAISRKLETLMAVGLGYITLGQSATTLSGGEAQRIKLALELSKRDTGKTLYILDEPTTGLHFADIELLLKVVHQLRDAGNTIVVIEHNLDVIKTADWIVDMGPEGGDGGGTVVIAGTPEEVAVCEQSYTGRYLKPFLSCNGGNAG